MNELKDKIKDLGIGNYIYVPYPEGMLRKPTTEVTPLVDFYNEMWDNYALTMIERCDAPGAIFKKEINHNHLSSLAVEDELKGNEWFLDPGMKASGIPVKMEYEDPPESSETPTVSVEIEKSEGVKPMFDPRIHYVDDRGIIHNKYEWVELQQ